VVIGGLVSSTLLTLILVPVLYWLVEGRKERKVIRVNRRLGKKEARSAKKATSGKGAIAASGTAPTASATVMTDTLPNPETVREATQVVNPDQELAVPEVTEEQAAEKTFQPATASSAPELAWTEEPIEVELDDESSMKWDESQVPVEPTPAVTGLAAEMPATKEENAAAPVTKKEIKAAKKKVKQDRKDQIKAAKNPRHSND
jgi:HAE1 family hydrophobic/amphiphilic exporter-1